MDMLLKAIRTAIESSEVTRYRIAKDTGISQPQLSRLMGGKAGLSIEALERLADYLGLEIIIRPKRQRKGR
jgi:transcriptional regulator with XRE-family HTH domain